jgi:hypothetical protein
VVTGLITRHRERGLPSPVTADVLARAGVSESLIPRTLQTLQTLELIDDDGRLTEALEGLRKAPEDEFKGRMAAWLKMAYADVFQFTDPSTDDDAKVRDAFRSYNPIGQQPRMVSLFLGLCEAAGLAPAKERPAPQRPRMIPRRAPAKPPARESKDKQPAPGGGGQAATLPTGMPPALAGVIASIPLNGRGWTKERRDQFVATFGAVLDFCVPIVAKEPGESEDDAPE